MNKQEIKNIMAIARPAIYALYGRWGNMELASFIKFSDSSIWIQVNRITSTNIKNYTLHIEDNKVTSLAERKLNV